VKEPSKFHNYETEKITREASDVTEYIELFGSSTRDRRAQFTSDFRPPTYVVHDDLGWKNQTTCCTRF